MTNHWSSATLSTISVAAALSVGGAVGAWLDKDVEFIGAMVVVCWFAAAVFGFAAAVLAVLGVLEAWRRSRR